MPALQYLDRCLSDPLYRALAVLGEERGGTKKQKGSAFNRKCALKEGYKGSLVFFFFICLQQRFSGAQQIKSSLFLSLQIHV